MSDAVSAAPVASVRYFTPGTIVLAALALTGLGFGAWRFAVGLAATTNLDDQYPWGLWIAMDVATGVALAAGGFTSAALVHVFHRERYHPVARAALLTALLGYTFVAIGLLFDLGRFYNVWHPLIMWQGNSVLFEVGICVMSYLTVLYLEFFPVVSERMRSGASLHCVLRLLNLPLRLVAKLSDVVVSRIMWLLVLSGIVLSCMHQSSLGSLMLIAPTKMHPLWYTPILPLLFLLSAISVGFPMVIFESLLASRSFRREPEMQVLSPLARIVPVLLGFYLLAKVVDLAVREAWVYIPAFDTPAVLFLAEVVGGVALPMLLLSLPAVRLSRLGLLASASLVVLGVALNRVNVFLVAYTPPYASKSYFPAIAELAVTIGLVSLLVLAYRFVVMNFPVLDAPHAEVSR
jgi:Ni/Fe-hydrogenase subunit HybB-like protein